MKIDKRHKTIGKIASKDATRRIITTLNVRRGHKGFDGEGCIVATDGRRLAVVPCELESGDVEGLIRSDAIARGDKERRKGPRRRNAKTPIAIDAGEDRLEMENGTNIPRLDPDGYTRKDEVFPETDRVVPDDYRVEYALNAELLAELSEALGAKGKGIRLRFRRTLEGIDAHSVVEVRPADKENKAVGLLMPMRTF